MLKIAQEIMLKSILERIAKELSLIFSYIDEKTVDNLEDTWKDHIEKGKIFLNNELKGEVLKFFMNENVQLDNQKLQKTIFQLGFEVCEHKINAINEILSTKIDDHDKIGIISFLLDRSAEELSGEYLY